MPQISKIGFDCSVRSGINVWASSSIVSRWHSRIVAQAAGAIETAARWVAHDPWNENAHRRLIQLHLAAGDRTAALRAYDSCRATLAAELHITPSPETETLGEHIRLTLLPIPGGTWTFVSASTAAFRATTAGTSARPARRASKPVYQPG